MRLTDMYKEFDNSKIEVRKIDLHGLSKGDQELLYSFQPTSKESELSSIVVCSFQPMITRLLKSDFFRLDSVLVGTKSDLILEVKGYLEPNGFSIRLKKSSKIFTPGIRNKKTKSTNKF